jgi:hypothetical protein
VQLGYQGWAKVRHLPKLASAEVGDVSCGSGPLLAFCAPEIEMVSHMTERSDLIDAGREQVVDAVDDATDYVRHNPVTSLLVLGAVVIGGSMLVAAMLRDDRPASASGTSMALASAAHGLGPRGTEVLSRIRDAAFSFALAKVVDTVEEMFPGFREHYERG